MKASDNPLPSLLFVETVDPAAPAAGRQRLFIDTDHHLKSIDSASTVTDWTAAAGNVATDTIWAAQGDIVVATGNDAAAVLTKGAAGTVPTAGASTLAYAFPPGHEFDYVEITSDVAITSATEATPDTVITATAVAFDGSTTVMINFYCAAMYGPATATVDISLSLYDGSTKLGIFGVLRSNSTSRGLSSVNLFRRLTPSNATHTYSVRGFVGSGGGAVQAGAGGTGTGVLLPAFIRITKV